MKKKRKPKKEKVMDRKQETRKAITCLNQALQHIKDVEHDLSNTGDIKNQHTELLKSISKKILQTRSECIDLIVYV